MATDISSLPVNGSHAPTSGYEGTSGAFNNATTASQGSFSTSAAPTQTSSTTTSEIPKDEVGWYFVEQYYTTLSRSPEKLYLFYNKRSQFVLGDETDKVPVCVGQKSINERIKDLDFRDCKVRVTNVDSQASDANIVIQVIGEISNKSQPHKKFVQTFVLAAQTNGYFVLNDIFRYLVEEEEEETSAQEAPTSQPSGFQEPAPTASGAPETETLSSSKDPDDIEHSAQLVDKELAAKTETPEITTPSAPVTNGVTATHASTDAPADESAKLDIPSAPEAGIATPSSIIEPEKPKDPSPTPALSPAKQAAQPAPTAAASAPSAAPTKPAVPKTWANLAAAANRVATPAAPSTQANAPSTAQPKAPSSSSVTQTTAQPIPAAATEAPVQREPSPEEGQQDEWTSVGGSRGQQSRAQTSASNQEGPQNRAYIKNVNENVDAKQLRSLLDKFGELAYFDIARQKNCAFVDFKTPEGYKAAVDANPHQLGNDRIVVEERRMKPGSYPYVPRGGMRGGRGGPGQGAGRGSFQGGRGGNFPNRGRGGNTGRGRGGAQSAQ